ncbi:hypothetical protein [Deinococcus planocerae]|uniref:hypothetical protein n=1 Tax=Deinococcus planocerae TaxID=1737569 RepID=UPI000C7EF68B|nr:hypothetical protein [Deinococcus planocerae]
MDLQAQIAHAGFPEGALVHVVGEGPGRVFRVTGLEGRGFEILLTDDAVQVYGEGPTVALVLGRLRERAEAGLPPARSPGEYGRQVFVGD